METDNTTIDPHGTDDGGDIAVIAGLPAGSAADDKKPDFKATEDGNLVEYGGHKYVREEALQGERTRAKGYADTLRTLEPLMPDFEEFLSSRSNGRAATADRAGRSASSDQGDYTEDELTGYAITRGYYGEDRKPDLSRAKADLDIMTAIADRRASKAVKPVETATAKDRAVANLRNALTQQFVDGEPIAEEKYLRAAFDAVPDEIKADPNVSNILNVVAAGLQALDDRRSGRGRGRREPTFREGGARANRTEEALDALDRAAARARGKSDSDWSKMSKAVGGDRSAALGGTILEDI